MTVVEVVGFVALGLGFALLCLAGVACMIALSA